MAFCGNNSDLSGSFTETEYGKHFDYAKATTPLDVEGKPYDKIVFVGPDGKGVRYAHIKKTVAYIVVDESDDGGYVVEKWNIKKHKEFSF